MVTLQFNRVNRKVLLIAGFFAVGAFAAYPAVMPQPSAATVTTAAKPAVVSANSPVMPQGSQQQAVRDPFQMPKEVLPPVSVSTVSRPAQPAPALPQFQLTGVAIGNGTAAAILESSAGSRSYQVGEYAGPYQVRRITSDSVVLVGPNGPHVLKMRR